MIWYYNLNFQKVTNFSDGTIQNAQDGTFHLWKGFGSNWKSVIFIILWLVTWFQYLVNLLSQELYVVKYCAILKKKRDIKYTKNM